MTLLSILAALAVAIPIRCFLFLYGRAADAGRRAWPYAVLGWGAIVAAAFILDAAALWWLVGFLVGPSILFGVAALTVTLRLCWWGLTKQARKLETVASLAVGLKVIAHRDGEARDASTDAEAVSGTN